MKTTRVPGFFGFIVRDTWLETDLATFRNEDDARAMVTDLRDPHLAKLIAGLRYRVKGEYVFPMSRAVEAGGAS